jgi:protocatechuate 3,4-dioxygenase beta subunit
MKFIIVFILAVGFIFSTSAMASDNARLNKMNFCKVTKETDNDYEPEVFETTNNLLRETGQESLYCGEKIIVSGRVVDQDCVPVADAKIYIWQIDCKGKYPYIPLKDNINEKLIHAEKLMTFTGNGTATTNNKGEFHFITVYPPAIHHLASHVNIRVEHRKLGNLQTRLMLKGHKVESPEDYPALATIAAIAAKKNVSIYDYQIVMPGATEDEY